MANPIPQGDWEVLTIPFVQKGNLLLIEGTIDGQRGNFILDFGAPYLVLNSTWFREGKTISDELASGVNGIQKSTRRTEIKKLQIQDLFYENVQADIADLREIENKRGAKILGLLGLNLFLETEVIIDVNKSVLQLKRNESTKKANLIPKATPEIDIPFFIDNNAIMIEGELGGKKLRFLFDTGAEVMLLDNGLGKKVTDNIRITRSMQLIGSGGGQVEVLAGNISGLQVGGKTFTGQKVIITDLDELNKSYTRPVQGLLGYGMLSQGVTKIDFKTNKIQVYLYISGQ